MDLLPRSITRTAGRAGAFVQNVLEVARFGGLQTGEEPAPYEVVLQRGTYRLRRYYAGENQEAPAIVLVPPLMLTAEVYDIAPATSAVTALRDQGVAPWVVDFGAPEREAGGLERTVSDHVLAVSDAIDEIRKRTDQDVHLGGYSQGGMFCYQTAAYRESEGLASVVTFGSPVDAHRAVPFGLPEDIVTRLVSGLADSLFSDRGIPAWLSRIGFQLLDPVKTVQQRIDFLLQLHDREALAGRERQRRFMQSEGWVAWPGPALTEFAEQFVQHNRMLSGGFEIDGKLVSLADLTCPVLCFVGEVDDIAPPASVRPVVRAAPRADIYQVSLNAGHFGLVVGSASLTTTWPTVAQWMRWLAEEGQRPEEVVPLTEDDIEPEGAEPSTGGLDLRYGIELATGVGTAIGRSAARAVGQGARSLRTLGANAVELLPGLVRLQRVERETPISLGLLLDEQAERVPDDTFFLFEGRGYSYADAKRRIDAVVRGLISVGVRQGQHVGVLMGNRPSALALVVALSRLGAVAVMLRPDGPIEREMAIAEVTRVIADPEHAELAADVSDVPVLVLGGGGEPRELDVDPSVTDMERIDPDEVDLPGWYVPNPGRAEDLAVVFFTGGGQSTTANRITNGRASLSAFGTASAGALARRDTVYSLTPVYHPSGLLVAIGGAVAAGARVALASDYDPAIFWDEVRRYGATVVSYTWTLCHELVEAPPDAKERHHPVRLFLGSGMPVSLWLRVVERFAPARVLEFYASTEGEAVLANVSGEKVGAKGRPLPGSADVALVRFDPVEKRVIEGPDGFAIPCDIDEVGLLLARTDRIGPSPVGTRPLRGVFEKGDSWLASGDLFHRDADGDFWLHDHAADVIHTSSGPVGSSAVEDVLGHVRWIGLTVVYGVPDDEGHERVVAAVTVRPEHRPDPGALTSAVASLDAASRPTVIRVVDEIPVTTWYRPRKPPLREEGIPEAGVESPVWQWDGSEYVPTETGPSSQKT